MTVCLLCDKIHKNQAKNLLHLMLYFSILEKIFFRLDFAAKIDYNITVLYGISRCVGMADEGDSKSAS